MIRLYTIFCGWIVGGLLFWSTPLAAQQISVSPDSFDVSIGTGDTSYHSLTIRNSGLEDLSWSIQVKTVPPVFTAMQRPAGYRNPNFDLKKTDRSFTAYNTSSSPSSWTSLGKPDLITNSNSVLVLTTTTLDSSILKALNEIGVSYDYINTSTFASVDMSPYQAIIVGMDGGYPVESDVLALANAASAGKTVIMVGGTNYSNYYNGMNLHLLQHSGATGWTTVSGSPHLTVTQPGHPLATDLPATYNFANLSATYYMIRITDTAATTVAVNGDGHPAIVQKNIGSGNLVYFVSSPGSSYWYNPDDYAIMRKVLQNALDISWLTAEPSAGLIAPGDSAVVSLFLDASSLPAGNYSVDILITSNDVDPADSVVVVPFDATVLPPEISLIPTGFDISIPAGDSSTTTLTVGNSGAGYLNWSAFVIYPDAAASGFSYPYVELTPGSGTVDPLGGSVQVDITTYTYPNSSGTYNFFLRVQSNDAETPEVDIPFNITVLPPEIGVAPTAINVQLASGDSTTQTVTISNTGSGNLVWDAFVYSGVRKTDAPQNDGERPRSATPKLRASDGRFTSSAVSGGLYKLGNSPSVLVLAAEGDTSYIINGFITPIVGTGLFSLSDFAILDDPLSITLGDLAPYRTVMVWSDAAFNDPVNIGDVLKQYVDNGGTIVMSTYCYSVNWGIQGGILDPNYSPFLPATQQSVAGTINMSTLPYPGHPIFANIVNAPTYWWNSNYSNPALNTGGIALAYDTSGYNVVAENEAGNIVGMVIFPPELTGGNAETALLFANALNYVTGRGNPITVSPTFGIVSPGGDQALTVRFNATGLDPGSYQASLVISSNDPDEPYSDVAINMAVLQPDPPVLTTIPDSLVFTLDPGDSATQMLTLGNAGTGNLYWNAWVNNGQIGPYGEINPSADTIAPTNTQDVSVKVWANTIPGVYRYAIVIQSNDFTQPDHEVPLIITVNPPVISVTPGTFTVTVPPADSTTRTMTIANIGAGVLNWNVSVIPAITATSHFEKSGSSKTATNNKGKTIARNLEGTLALAPGDFVPKASSSVPLTCVTVDPTTNLIYAQENQGYGFFSYNPATDQWTPLTSCPIYSGNNGGATYLNGKIYTCYTGGGGGMEAGGGSIGIYDIAGDSWTSIPNFVYTGNIETYNGRIYLIDDLIFKSYDPVALTWDTLTHPGVFPFNSDNSWGGLRYFNGYLYNLSGDGDSAMAKYHVATDEWTFLPNAPDGAVLGTAIDPTAAKFYASGSYGDSNFYEFDLITETWSVQRQPYVEFNDGGMAYVSDPDHHGIYFVEGQGGTGFVFYETAPRQTWLTVEPSSGAVAAGNSQETTLKFRPDTLAVGDYFATLRISSNDPAQPIYIVPVHLIVNSDVQAPTITLSFFQDNYLTAYVDVVGVMNEGLMSIPTGHVMKPSGYTPSLSIDTVDAANRVYYAHFKMDTIGTYSFTMEAVDSAGNMGSTTRSLTAALAKAGMPASLVSNDQIAGLAVTEHTLRSDAYVTVYQSARIETPDMTGVSDAYVFGPAGIELAKPVSITFDYSSLVTAGLDESHFAVYRVQGDEMHLIPTTVNPDRRTATVQTDRLGKYQLFYNPSVTSEINNGLPKAFALGQNFPNPFNPTTTIRYDLPLQSHVRLSVYNMLGQEVRTLVNGTREAGFHQITWDGRNEAGHAVASGIYIYRIRADRFVNTRKMLLIK